jgi:hypothetical protein
VLPTCMNIVGLMLYCVCLLAYTCDLCMLEGIGLVFMHVGIHNRWSPLCMPRAHNISTSRELKKL